MEWEKYKKLIHTNLFMCDGKTGINSNLCHGSYFRQLDGTVNTYWALDKVPYTKEQIEKWVEIVNAAGFKCTLEYGNWVCAHVKLDFKISLNIADYINRLHFRIGLTVMRMICYSLVAGYHEVVDEVIADYTPEKDAYESITTAFQGKKAIVSQYQGAAYINNHNLPGKEDEVSPVKIMTREQLETLLKTKPNLNHIKQIHE